MPGLLPEYSILSFQTGEEKTCQRLAGSFDSFLAAKHYEISSGM